MSTYYGYVDRDVEQQINWKTIGESISKPFIDRAETLKKERAAVDKNTREILSELSKPELGKNRNANTLIIDASVKFAEQQRAYDTLYRQNALSYNEYLQNSQNLKDQATLFSKTPKFTNERYETIMNAFNKGEVGVATTKGFEILQNSILNPNETSVVLDKAGYAYLGKKEKGEDGTVTITKDPNGIRALSDVTSILGTFYIPTYNVEKEWGKNYADLKVKYEKLVEEKDPTVYSQGKIKTISDVFENNEDFRNTVSTLAEGVSIDPYKGSSVLFETIGKTKDGKEYTPVFGEPKSDNEVQIIVDSSGNAQYKLTESQQKTVKDFLVSTAKSKLSREIDVKTSGQLTDAGLARAKFEEDVRKTKKDESIVDSNSRTLGEIIGKAARGRSVTELNDAANSIAMLSGFDKGEYSSKNGGTIVLSYTDPQTQTVKQSTISTRGKNTKSLIQDISSTVRSKDGKGKDINWGIVESVGIGTAKSMGKFNK